ncbi:hypothetical protein [Streptomyces sp. CA-251251]|uniref:hypothetical protein n=1 Tax=Streptomyces sp. CA-251251 TaxID=3240063 RepID=UPI003D8C3509
MTLYRKKVRKHTPNPVLYGSDGATCPVRALCAYLSTLASAGRIDGPLFVRVDRWGRIAPPMTRHGRVIGHPAGRMTAEAVAEVVERLAIAAGVTRCAVASPPPHGPPAMTRWRSPTRAAGSTAPASWPGTWTTWTV